MSDWAMEKASELSLNLAAEPFHRHTTMIAAAIRESSQSGFLEALRLSRRLARITAPDDADFTSVWGDYEHGVDDMQAVLVREIDAVMAKTTGRQLTGEQALRARAAIEEMKNG